MKIVYRELISLNIDLKVIINIQNLVLLLMSQRRCMMVMGACRKGNLLMRIVRFRASNRSNRGQIPILKSQRNQSSQINTQLLGKLRPFGLILPCDKETVGQNGAPTPKKD